MDLEQGAVLGSYRIVRVVGRGGMGVVYEAEQIQLKRSVALKVLPDFHAASADAVTRFSREAEAGARLHHPNIVQVYETGSAERSHYIAMEFVRGESLAQVVERTQHARDSRAQQAPKAEDTRRSALAATTDRAYIQWTVCLVVDVLRGLDHAHKLGVLHRDIKPQNLLLDAEGSVKIADFGLARLLEDPAFSQPGQPHGTPWYMSPEQVAVGLVPIDHRTDVYSTGVTLYELLTLSRPFPGEDITTVFRRILHKDPAPPRTINPRLPRDLETIVLKAIDKDPDKRYTSAMAFAEDLERFLNFENILARPVGRAARLFRRAARHRAVSLLVLLLLVTLAVGAALMIRAASQRRQRREDLLARAEAQHEAGAYDEEERLLRDLVAHVDPDNRAAARRLAVAVGRRRQEAQRAAQDAERLIAELRFDRAREVLERARRMAPTDARIADLLAKAAGRRRVRFLVEGGAARLYASEYIQIQRRFQRPRRLGEGSDLRATFAAGDYRITAVGDGDRWAETWLPVDPYLALDEVRLFLRSDAEARAGMVRIEAGSYPIGEDGDQNPGANPRSSVELDEFWIDAREATQRQYERYLQHLRRAGARLPQVPQTGWDENGKFLAGAGDLPMIGLTWLEANRFLAFLGKRLPTETEWEAAARGPTGRLFPWGDDFDAARAHIGARQAKPAGAHGGPDSGYAHGLYDMIGNVAEWTADRFLPYCGNDWLEEVQRARGRLNPLFDFNRRVQRGGSYATPQAAAERFASATFRMSVSVHAALFGGVRGVRGRPLAVKK